MFDLDIVAKLLSNVWKIWIMMASGNLIEHLRIILCMFCSVPFIHFSVIIFYNIDKSRHTKNKNKEETQ